MACKAGSAMCPEPYRANGDTCTPNTPSGACVRVDPNDPLQRSMVTCPGTDPGWVAAMAGPGQRAGVCSTSSPLPGCSGPQACAVLTQQPPGASSSFMQVPCLMGCPDGGGCYVDGALQDLPLCVTTDKGSGTPPGFGCNFGTKQCVQGRGLEAAGTSCLCSPGDTAPAIGQTFACGTDKTCGPKTCTVGSSNCFTSVDCAGACGSPPGTPTYACTGGACGPSSCTAGTTGCFTTPDCDGKCTPPPARNWSCSADKTACQPSTCKWPATNCYQTSDCNGDCVPPVGFKCKDSGQGCEAQVCDPSTDDDCFADEDKCNAACAAGLTGGQIALIVVGSAVLLAVVVGAVVWYLRDRRTRAVASSSSSFSSYSRRSAGGRWAGNRSIL